MAFKSIGGVTVATAGVSIEAGFYSGTPERLTLRVSKFGMAQEVQLSPLHAEALVTMLHSGYLELMQNRREQLTARGAA